MTIREVVALGFPQNLYTMIFRNISCGEYGDPFPKEHIPSTTEIDKMMEYISGMLDQPDRKKLEIFLKYMKGQSVQDIAKDYGISQQNVYQKIDHIEWVLGCFENMFILEHGVDAYEAKEASFKKVIKELAEKELAEKELAECLSKQDTLRDPFYDVSLHGMGFGTRILHTLSWRKNINTVGDILENAPSEILLIRGIGMGSYIEIISALHDNFNITVDEEKDEWIFNE